MREVWRLEDLLPLFMSVPFTASIHKSLERREGDRMDKGKGKVRRVNNYLSKTRLSLACSSCDSFFFLKKKKKKKKILGKLWIGKTAQPTKVHGTSRA